MSVDTVNPSRRNPWKVATIVLAAVMALGLIAVVIGAALRFGGDRGWNDRSGGRQGMGYGQGQRVCDQRGKCTWGGGTGRKAGMPTPMPMPTRTIVVSNAPTNAPTDAPSAVTVVAPAGGMSGGMTCTTDGQTTTCTGSMGGTQTVMVGMNLPADKCRASGTCPGMNVPNDKGGVPSDKGGGNGWGNGMDNPKFSRAGMMGMMLIAGGLLLTFLTALAALILAILAFRRSRRNRGQAAVATPVAPVVAPVPDAATPEPTVVVAAPAADATPAESVVTDAEAVATERPVKPKTARG